MKFIQIVKRFIFFDEKWCFPDSDSSDEYISGIIGEENLEEYKKISMSIIDKLNNNDIEPYDFEKSFYRIVNELNRTPR